MMLALLGAVTNEAALRAGCRGIDARTQTANLRLVRTMAGSVPTQPSSDFAHDSLWNGV